MRKRQAERQRTGLPGAEGAGLAPVETHSPRRQGRGDAGSRGELAELRNRAASQRTAQKVLKNSADRRHPHALRIRVRRNQQQRPRAGRTPPPATAEGSGRVPVAG